MEALFSMLKRDGFSRLCVVHGPQQGGKTRFLKHFQRIWMRDEVLKLIAPVIYVGFSKNMSTPADAGMALISSLRETMRELGESFPEVTVRMSCLSDPSVDQVSLSQVVQTLVDDLPLRPEIFSILRGLHRMRMINPKVVTPIYVFDDIGSSVKNWEPSSVAHLATLLKQFVNSEGPFAVISTSDDFISDWFEPKLLPQGSGLLWFEVGMGFFCPLDARKYLVDFVIPKVNCKSPSLKVPPLDDDKWMDIFEVCGGMAPLLSSCAEKAMELQSWNGSLDLLLLAAMEQVRRVLGSCISLHFTKLSRHLISKGGVAGFGEVTRDVFGGDFGTSRDKLLELIAANMIHVRWDHYVVTPVFSDFDPEFGVELHYIMFKTPAIMAAIKRCGV